MADAGVGSERELMPNHQSPRVVRSLPPPTRPQSPHRVVVNVTPQITTSNANSQQNEGLLALILGIAIGIAGALAAMERTRHRD